MREAKPGRARAIGTGAASSNNLVKAAYAIVYPATRARAAPVAPRVLAVCGIVVAVAMQSLALQTGLNLPCRIVLIVAMLALTFGLCTTWPRCLPASASHEDRKRDQARPARSGMSAGRYFRPP